VCLFIVFSVIFYLVCLFVVGFLFGFASCDFFALGAGTLVVLIFVFFFFFLFLCVLCVLSVFFQSFLFDVVL